MNDKIKEFNHVLQSGYEKISEFDKKGHELLINIETKANEVFNSINTKNNNAICSINKMIKETTDKLEEAHLNDRKRIEEKSDKAWNFLKWFAILSIGSSLALSFANKLVLETKANDLELKNYYMTKDNARKAFMLHEERIKKLESDSMLVKDNSNYQLIIESLFDEKSRGNKTR